jgi:hypothetical protein
MTTSDLSWSVNRNVWGRQQRSSDVLACKFKACTKIGQNFKEALRETLLDVCLQVGTPAVMYSGGADSEMLIRELRSLNKRPEIHFVRFDDGYNDADYRHVCDFARDMGIKPFVHDHNIEAFLNSRLHIELGLKFLTSDISLLTTYKYAQHLGKAVLLGPELLLQKHQSGVGASDTDDWFLIVGEHTFSAAEFQRQTQQPLFGELYYHNSNLLHSLMVLPEVQSLVRNEYPGRISMSYVKNEILQHHLGYTFTATKKRHGYEPVYHTFRRAVNEVKAALPFVQTEIRVPVDHALRQLEGLTS